MNPFRTLSIRRAILDALKLSNGFALPEQTLRKHVGDLERPQPDDAEWAEHVTFLEEHRHIVRVPSDLDDSLVQFALTERGRTLLASL